MVKIIANDIRPGQILEHNGKLWAVAKIMHTQPGKGGAYMQVEMKDIRSGTKLNERFRSSETVEKVRLDEHEYQYLYKEGEHYTLMDLESYEQIHISEDVIGDVLPYLQESMVVRVESYEGKPISLSVPDTVVLEVKEAEAVVKGQTAASSYKPAIMENGVRVMVPPFIEVGTRIVVKTADSTYVERAKD